MLNPEQISVFLEALRKVDFNWVAHLKSIWQDSDYDAPNLHGEQRTKLMNELERLKLASDSHSPLGLVLIGEAGAGKTHLLGAVRKQAIEQGLGFILVDMTDVRDFWETVLQGYVGSLQQVMGGGVAQYQTLIEFLLVHTAFKYPRVKLTQAKASDLKKCINFILTALAKRDRASTIKFQNTLRALFLLDSEDFMISAAGYNWLQGIKMEEEDRLAFGFTSAVASQASEIVEGLSWVMSLRGPSVLAFDQIDSIVTQHHFSSGSGESGELSDEQRLSRAIIESIGGGLMALRDKTARTLTILSCLEATWEILRTQAVSAFKDRFHQPPIGLVGVQDASLAEQIIALRLRKYYAELDFSLPYSTWPFSPQFFQSVSQQNFRTRLILQRCDDHRNRCLSENKVKELSSFFDIPLQLPSRSQDLNQELDRLLASLQEQGIVHDYLEVNNEDKLLARLLQKACQWLVWENPTPASVDVGVETDFLGGQSYAVLHGRLRLTHRENRDREQHLCLRALQQTNPKAYQTRLKAAMTASGIDRALTFRRLMIVRTQEIPGGAVTQKLTQAFQNAGGWFTYPTEAELLTLIALGELEKKRDPQFQAWLRQRRLVSQLPFLAEAVTWLFGEFNHGNNDDLDNQAQKEPSPQPEASTPTHSPPQKETQPSAKPRLTLGALLVGQQTKGALSIPLQDLSKHTVILAGSGSGKTVLARRLVEEAVLLGVPAIVIDGANDLARLGDPWPAPPELWSEEDREKARRYHQRSEVVIWTPGRESGNPLTLEPLPDLAAVAHDLEELNQAADMARDSLQDIVAPGKTQASMVKRGILKAALLYLAQNGGGRLPELIELLGDLPPEAGGGIADAAKKAQSMADSLRAEILNNSLLHQSGAPLDPGILFGLGQFSDRTRISILNFIGLPSLGAQQQFLNQLFMTLFIWIKKNPAPPDRPLRGLLVIDEAKDFAPSGAGTPCKASLNRLVAQARKYGLGLIFATQEPKSIDHNIIANCSTQFYGRTNSPASIDVIQDQLRQRGGSGRDIARLEKGQFYASSESLTQPAKILTSLCLSHHPAAPLEEREVLRRARTYRH